MAKKKRVDVVIVMGSKSDLPVMRKATEVLSDWGVSCRTEILSAHRTPGLLQKSVSLWEREGIKVVIAGAGGAAHLPGMLASFASFPVVGVPVKSSAMNGLDALLSIAQMPKGVPVATVGVDNATNAALLTLSILGTSEDREGTKVRKKMIGYKKRLNAQILKDRRNLMKKGVVRFLKEKH